MVENMLTGLLMFASNGSGWILQKHLVANFLPKRGSSFIELPLCLRNQCYFLNKRSRDDFECFNFSYTAWYHELHWPNLADPARHIKIQLTNPAIFRKLEATKPRGVFSMPTSFHKIQHFEIMNNVQANVFHFSKRDLLLMYISNNRSIEPTMDLLYSSLTKTYDFRIFTNNVIKVVRTVKQKLYRNSFRLCRNCFALSYSKDQHQVHDDECRNHVPATMMKSFSGSKILRLDSLLQLLFTSTLSRF